MEPGSESMRDRLLSHLPQPAALADYRGEVASLLARNDKGLRREARMVTALWLFAVALSTAFLCIGTRHLDRTEGPGWVCLACFVLLYPSVELLKHFINRTRVEMLRETKQLQVQVLELHELLRKEGGR